MKAKTKVQIARTRIFFNFQISFVVIIQKMFLYRISWQVKFSFSLILVFQSILP